MAKKTLEPTGTHLSAPLLVAPTVSVQSDKKRDGTAKAANGGTAKAAKRKRPRRANTVTKPDVNTIDASEVLDALAATPREPKARRRYDDGDLAALWGRAAGRCSHPECRKPLIYPATAEDPTVIVGERAHIFAFSDHGPRPNASMPTAERNKYDNLLLLCGHCHNLVDGQWRHYTVARLRLWKSQHEAWVSQRLQESANDIEFRALQLVCDALINQEINTTPDFKVTDTDEKLAKNELSGQVRKQLFLGIIQAPAVARYLEGMTTFDPRFAERVRGGFVRRYLELREQGLRGDVLFFALADYSSGGSTDFSRQAAGRAVLTHLFNVCDVFER